MPKKLDQRRCKNRSSLIPSSWGFRKKRAVLNQCFHIAVSVLAELKHSSLIVAITKFHIEMIGIENVLNEAGAKLSVF
jgi:hypothetical protein